MKNIIDKNKTKKIQNKFKITDGIMISDSTLISNTFNKFFINIGPKRFLIKIHVYHHFSSWVIP